MDNNENKQVPETPVETPVEAPVLPVEEPLEVPAETPVAVIGETDDGKKMSIAALVLGILGIVGGYIPVVCYFTTVCAILGIFFGVKGRKKSVAAYGKPSGLATAGLVLGIVGAALAVIGLICATVLCSGAMCLAVESGGFPQ